MDIVGKILLGILISAGAVLVLYILFLLLFELFTPQKEYDRPQSFARKLLNFNTGIAVWLSRVDIKVTGMDALSDLPPYYLVSNHRSNFDPILTWYVLRKRPISFLTKESNLKIPVAGAMARRCCFYSLTRTDIRADIKTFNRTAELLKTGLVDIGVYPEGTRNPQDEMLPFHDGVFKIAQRAEAPIVVMTARGTDDIHKNWPLKRTTVCLDFLKIIPYADFAALNTHEIGENVRAIMEENLKK